jgi:DNA-binding transcriptional LysR family regulator
VSRVNLIRHFPVFLAAAEEEHFHRAARRLGIAQSAVSRRIGLLEADLGGVQLFERLPKGVKLTPAGKTFLKDVQAIMAQVEKARRRAAESARGAAEVLNVGYNQAVPRHRFLAEAFRRFRAERRGAALKLHPTDAATQIAALASGELDAAFLYGIADDADFEGIDIFLEDFLLALPAGHRLADAPQIQLQDLANEDFIWFRRSPGLSLHDLLLEACARLGFEPRIALEGYNSETVFQFVASGMGVGFVPASQLGAEPAGVALRPVAGFSAPYLLRLVWRRGAASPLLDAFIAVVRACRDALAAHAAPGGALDSVKAG